MIDSDSAAHKPSKYASLHKQALCAVIEGGIKQALSLSVNGDALLSPLADKRCLLFIHEVDICFVFQFSQVTNTSVQVLTCELPTEDELHELSDEECFISVSLYALPELKNTNQLTKLIKQGKLDFYGNLSIAQKFSKVFANIEFDIEESLSTYIGDAQAFTLVEQAKRFGAHASKQFSLFTQMLSDAALEEKPIAVRPIMVANFSDEVNRLKMDTERLEAKINRYAQRQDSLTNTLKDKK